ncbi:MAG TPA: hypothetical protein VG406_20160, partial [Isosphaeraceae bacterium]|nr:hypothetical protein [Isosphaeraceae bacterium]
RPWGHAPSAPRGRNLSDTIARVTMKHRRRNPIALEQLERRAVLSHGGHGGFGFGEFGFGPPAFSTNPTVQADLTKIQTDRQQLQADVTNLQPTILKDQAAILTAINNSTTVQDAKTTLTNDQNAWMTTYQTDVQAIVSATTTAARSTAIQQLWTDWSKAVTTLNTDESAVQTAISNDPGVQAAKQQLTTDLAPITKDQATLQADQVQLQKDIQAAQSSNSTGTGTSTMIVGHGFGFGFF